MWNQRLYEQGLLEGKEYDDVDVLDAEIAHQVMESLSDSQAVSEFGVGFVRGLTEALMQVSIVEAAKFYWEQDMDSEYVEAARRLVSEGKAKWILDPEHDKVVGLVQTWNDDNVHRKTAYVVVYLDGESFDHEENMDILDLTPVMTDHLTGRVFMYDDLNAKLVVGPTLPDHDEWHLWTEYRGPDGLYYVSNHEDYTLSFEEFWGDHEENMEILS